VTFLADDEMGMSQYFNADSWNHAERICKELGWELFGELEYVLDWDGEIH
jgi:hypothetical protein